MTSGGFLSTASVVTILALVALLAVASAVVLAPLDRTHARRHVLALVVCLLIIGAMAVLAVVLIRGTI